MALFLSGNSGDASIGGSPLKVTSWKATEEIQILPTTNKGSNGFEEAIYGNKKISGSVEANWDAEASEGNPPAAGQSVSEESIGVALSLAIEEDGPAYSIPHALISKVEITNPVDGLVSYSFDFESSGTYTRPGES